jgi:hypothetical protein
MSKGNSKMRYNLIATMAFAMLFLASAKNSALVAGEIMTSPQNSIMKIALIDLNAAPNRRMTAKDIESSGTHVWLSASSPVFQDFPSEDYIEDTQVRQIDTRVVLLYDKSIYEFDSTGEVVFVDGKAFLSGKYLRAWFREYVIPLNLSLNYRPSGARELRLHRIKTMKANKADVADLKKNS